MTQTTESNKIITRHYRCNYCNETHSVSIKKRLIDNQPKYPFPYVFLHNSIKEGTPKELLTILYFDRDAQVRGQEILEFGNDNLFSKEQVVAMMEPLMEEVRILRKENLSLKAKLKELK